jgi:isochorismate synthase EntC
MDGSGAGVFYVGLRSVLMTRDCAWAFAGAGIVAGSAPDAEWREVNHKLRAIRSALTTTEVEDR